MAWAAAARERIPAVAVDSVSEDGWRHLLGLACEYAVGLDLVRDAYADRMAWLPREFADWVRTQVRRHRAAPDDDGVRALLEAACYLAQVDSIVVRIGLWGSPEQAAPVLAGMGSPSTRTRLWTAIEAELTALWRLYCDRSRDDLTAWGDARASVPMDRRTGVHGDFHAAYADFIVGPLLLEIKAGYVASDWDLQTAHDQVARYGRLAHSAGHQVSVTVSI